ncbi:DUF2946 family protein [Luteimonas sp. 50]|uniref:DUF2946 family protein n=1 Tax=Cognatiluteimonas sedimenti TaxID=2927791 RepID=A0ABT0A2K9_9GAMM|nr:DUF2946 family protein [Lysobacter sedimenti]MCJ0825212.1 DUF2946 family protein [Lysobacter sedimenti]
MIRSPALQRPMARLALVAMLLLATLPTLGRLQGARADSAGAAAQSAWAAMCTTAGLRDVAPPAIGQPVAGNDGGTPTPPGHGEDCAYCPLLAAVVAALALVAFFLPQRLPPCLCTWHRPAVRTTLHPCGLGSRGPPLAL